MIARTLLTAVAALGLAGGAWAQAGARPDLNGTWVLNVARSDYGDFPGPNAQTLNIRQDGAALHIGVAATVRRSTRSYDLDLPLDGQEVRFPLSADIRVGTTILRSASANWRGEALVVTETVQHMQEMTVLETVYTRSPDGRSLSLRTNPKGEDVQSTLVFERAGGEGRDPRRW
ncbi:MAG: hypothetical protein WA840_03525 [Caulobacteraceae bacterium]